jgi:hypothetical protein
MFCDDQRKVPVTHVNQHKKYDPGPIVSGSFPWVPPAQFLQSTSCAVHVQMNNPRCDLMPYMNHYEMLSNKARVQELSVARNANSCDSNMNEIDVNHCPSVSADQSHIKSHNRQSPGASPSISADIRQSPSPPPASVRLNVQPSPLLASSMFNQPTNASDPASCLPASRTVHDASPVRRLASSSVPSPGHVAPSIVTAPFFQAVRAAVPIGSVVLPTVAPSVPDHDIVPLHPSCLPASPFAHVHVAPSSTSVPYESSNRVATVNHYDWTNEFRVRDAPQTSLHVPASMLDRYSSSYVGTSAAPRLHVASVVPHVRKAVKLDARQPLSPVTSASGSKQHNIAAEIAAFNSFAPRMAPACVPPHVVGIPSSREHASGLWRESKRSSQSPTAPSSCKQLVNASHSAISCEPVLQIRPVPLPQHVLSVRSARKRASDLSLESKRSSQSPASSLRYPNHNCNVDLQAQLRKLSQAHLSRNPGSMSIVVKNEQKICIPAFTTCAVNGVLLFHSDELSRKLRLDEDDTVMVRPIHIPGATLIVNQSVSSVANNKIVCSMRNTGPTEITFPSQPFAIVTRIDADKVATSFEKYPHAHSKDRSDTKDRSANVSPAEMKEINSTFTSAPSHITKERASQVRKVVTNLGYHLVGEENENKCYDPGPVSPGPAAPPHSPATCASLVSPASVPSSFISHAPSPAPSLSSILPSVAVVMPLVTSLVLHSDVDTSSTSSLSSATLHSAVSSSIGREVPRSQVSSFSITFVLSPPASSTFITSLVAFSPSSVTLPKSITDVADTRQSERSNIICATVTNRDHICSNRKNNDWLSNESDTLRTLQKMETSFVNQRKQFKVVRSNRSSNGFSCIYSSRPPSLSPSTPISSSSVIMLANNVGIKRSDSVYQISFEDDQQANKQYDPGGVVSEIDELTIMSLDGYHGYRNCIGNCNHVLPMLTFGCGSYRSQAQIDGDENKYDYGPSSSLKDITSYLSSLSLISQSSPSSSSLIPSFTAATVWFPLPYASAISSPSNNAHIFISPLSSVPSITICLEVQRHRACTAASSISSSASLISSSTSLVPESFPTSVSAIPSVTAVPSSATCPFSSSTATASSAFMLSVSSALPSSSVIEMKLQMLFRFPSGDTFASSYMCSAMSVSVDVSITQSLLSLMPTPFPLLISTESIISLDASSTMPIIICIGDRLPSDDTHFDSGNSILNHMYANWNHINALVCNPSNICTVNAGNNNNANNIGDLIHTSTRVFLRNGTSLSSYQSLLLSVASTLLLFHHMHVSLSGGSPRNCLQLHGSTITLISLWFITMGVHYHACCNRAFVHICLVSLYSICGDRITS